MILLAHHVELQHVPVLLLFLGVGFWLGWQVLSLGCKRREKHEEPRTPLP